MCFFRKRRERKRALEAEMAAKKESQVQKKAVEEPKVKEVSPEVSEKKVEAKEEKRPDVVLENKVEPKPEVKEEKAPKIAKYHVSQNKDEGTENFKKWRVRKEGSTKTIKFFDTQKEAIQYAEQLAESQGSSVVIHKIDGSIRKQDYTKKE